MATNDARTVCPVSAISFTSGNQELLIDDACFGCGLCVLRCPFGSLFMDESGHPAMAEVTDQYFKPAELAEFQAFESSLDRRSIVPLADTEATLRALMETLRPLQKEKFYRLVGNLLTAIGMPTLVSRHGDTSNRMDAVVVDARQSVPVEIKSPTEVESVNVKSVQQALENKVIMESRAPYVAEPTTTSLAIGYLPAAERSDVSELIEDIYTAFGFNIGVIDVRALYGLVWSKYIAFEEIDTTAIRELKGVLP
jgi:ferredoxin